MTEIRFLPEITDLSDGDWVVAQKSDGTAITGKCKASALQGVSPQDLANTVSVLQQEIAGKSPVGHTHQISDVQNLQSILDSKATVGVTGFSAYRSQTPPQNKNIGDKWYQINATNLPINEWNWDGTYWRSNFQDFRASNSINPNAAMVFNLGLEDRFGYYIQSLYYNYYQQARITDNTNYWAINLAAKEGNYNTVGDFYTIREFKSKPAEYFIKETIDLSRYVSLTINNAANLTISIVRFAQSGFNMPSAYFNFVMRYQIIYKGT